MADARRPNLNDEAHNNARVRHCASAEFNLFVLIHRFDVALHSERLPALKKRKEKGKCEKSWKFRGEPDGSGS